MSRVRTICAVLLLGLVLAVPVHAQNITVTSVKATYLYKFGLYVEWPTEAFAQPAAPLVIGVSETDSIVPDLRAITAAGNVNGHPVVVRLLKPGDSLRGVHILYLDTQSETGRALLMAAQGLPILTVTDGEVPDWRKGALHFVIENGRVRFEAFLTVAARQHLQLGTQLIKVALNASGGS
ncbi:MAG: YfiR family protein [Burkholderiaceae bacterium]|nr:MAG: YfiR family protein [Burkholderiaceae bacterium]